MALTETYVPAGHAAAGALTVTHDGVAPDDAAPAIDGTPRLPDYVVTGRLGEGGMGVVWRAIQRSTRREVALKLMSAGGFGSDRARARFEREVELAARLEHPGVAAVYDAGVHEGVHYYAMQLVDGVPLDVYVADHKPGKRDLLALLRDVCLAVQHAHQRGIIHRDLKPSNILVTKDGKPVVVDFGLAKQSDGTADGVTIKGQVAGTPAYMSPEQAAGRVSEIDTRSDVYSLGVILYRLLTGHSPHDLSGSNLDAMRRIAEDEAPSPRMASKDASRVVDRELETLMLKALAREPDRRYASAGALAQDLDNYLRGEPLLAKRPTASYVLRKRLHKHRVAVAATLGALLLTGMAGAGAATYRYYQPVTLPINSNPSGATIFLNGVAQNGCGLTPCRIKLGPGKHRIELRHPGEFAPTVRTVDVAWGQVSSDAFEPITLTPTYRTVVFDTQPAGVEFMLRRTDEPGYYTVRPPQMQLVPVGRYEVDLGRAPFEVDPNAKVLEFPPGLESMRLTLQLTPR